MDTTKDWGMTESVYLTTSLSDPIIGTNELSC